MATSRSAQRPQSGHGRNLHFTGTICRLRRFAPPISCRCIRLIDLRRQHRRIQALAGLAAGAGSGGPGTIQLNGTAINVNQNNGAAASFSGPVLLGADVTINTDVSGSTDNNVSFTSSIDGGHSLTIMPAMARPPSAIKSATRRRCRASM